MSASSTSADRAAALPALHRPGNPVVLPTVWDAWSARLASDAGFAALTVGSHPVADSIGKPDNEGMEHAALVGALRAAADEAGVRVRARHYGLPLRYSWAARLHAINVPAQRNPTCCSRQCKRLRQLSFC
jgi:hypothetical protein